MLNRWVAAQRGEAGLGLKPRRRPRMAGECKDLNECDKWRSQILREIGGKVMEIQNSSLEEARGSEVDIPMYIGGEAIKTGKKIKMF